MNAASAETVHSSWPRLVLLLAVFLSVAAISALLAWAAVRGPDTISRRLIAVPNASIDIAISALDLQIQAAMGLKPALPPIPDIATPAIAEPPMGAQTPISTQDTNGGITATPVLPVESTATIAPIPQPSPPISSVLWKANAARYVRKDSRAKIAIIVSGLGLRALNTQMALDRLPPLVTLAFSPYGQNLEKSIQAARAKNQEILLELPMEPVYFPSSDPGPYGLLSTNTADDNIQRLEMVAQKSNQAVGFLAFMGSKFLANDPILRPIINNIKKRGLIFVDNLSAINSQASKISTDIKTPFAAVTLILDTEPSADAIKQKLKDLETQANSSGYAVGMIHTYPISIDAIANWISALDTRGISFVPITAMIDIGQ